MKIFLKPSDFPPCGGYIIEGVIKNRNLQEKEREKVMAEKASVEGRKYVSIKDMGQAVDYESLKKFEREQVKAGIEAAKKCIKQHKDMKSAMAIFSLCKMIAGDEFDVKVEID